MEAVESAKYERGAREGGLVAVDTGEAAARWRGWAVDDFVPGCSAGSEDLYEDGGEVHVTEGLGPGLEDGADG